MLRTQTHFIQPFQKAMCLCAIGGLLCFGLPITVHAKSKVDVNAKLDPAYQKLLRSNTSKNIQNSKPCPKPNQRIPIKTPQDIENLNKISQKSTTNTCHVVPAIDPSLRIPNDVVFKITKENFPLLQEIVLKVTKTNKTVLVTNPPSKKMTVEEFNALNDQIACNQKKGIVITDPLKKLPKCP